MALSNFVQVSRFCTSVILRKTQLNNPKPRSKSSREWLMRQLNDPYVKEAKLHNFRCRSAYKLLQINDRYDIIKAGDTVVDCGAAPGGWSQVSTTLSNASRIDTKKPTGKVIGIDKRGMMPLDGAILLFPYDFTTQEAQDELKKILRNRKIDLLLSDMAPNSTCMKELDHDMIIDLAYNVLRFAVLNSRPGATCLIKLWSGRNSSKFEESVKKFYEQVNYVKPDASRGDSSEIYILGRNFKGIQENSLS